MRISIPLKCCLVFEFDGGVRAGTEYTCPVCSRVWKLRVIKESDEKGSLVVWLAKTDLKVLEND